MDQRFFYRKEKSIKTSGALYLYVRGGGQRECDRGVTVPVEQECRLALPYSWRATGRLTLAATPDRPTTPPPPPLLPPPATRTRSVILPT
ncbi:hypothetical protein J6590_031754 [Homalodisca vitripennis]|nr:hypothetical protein J6590_031754 [Homalodisca vitripennis]